MDDVAEMYLMGNHEDDDGDDDDGDGNDDDGDDDNDGRRRCVTSDTQVEKLAVAVVGCSLIGYLGLAVGSVSTFSLRF